ncbi:MAG: LysM peptidoglycan-binding domain-containing M23 family metallopeptidase [Proteobacteria bacterium]|nr:LysM peptidoglycan-binding domain-containing M23 family metallopeptidase [Pseudomonadota bacterium]
MLTGLMLVTSACGMFYDNSGRRSPSRSTPAAAQPVETAPQQPFAAVPPPGTPAVPIPASGVHRVERGNTVYSISRLYGVPVRAIIETNGLTPPYLLKVGDSLTIPRRRGHRVARGETVYSISRSYGVPMSELTRANGIAPPYTIVVGQELVIPAAPSTQVAAANPQPAPGGTVDVETLPAPAPAARPTPAPPPPPVAKATPRQIEALPKPPARAGKTFLWPVRGKLISGFGGQQGGRHNDGINIGAKRGTTVMAAENGVVAYAGNELRGFGNLLLIKHADGYMTAYAHNEALLVGRGAKVRKGQPIARVGSTGSVGSPQLHFEIRKGRKSVDPLRYLPRQSASN